MNMANFSFRSIYGPPTRTDYRLIVENLSSRVSWQDLKGYMRQAGEVTFADAHKYPPPHTHTHTTPKMKGSLSLLSMVI